ncbi:H-2 class II histocompatibility antigen, E-S beta chain-like [Chanos chanos]|uniref:H-2 class II histocompatibility antigen, E-S beta chain-like n=1 Tax=Chanos chanos TaxID=29144 RepID=A0A6J2UQK6_CHACN|nr:H-2 class II histocompatibility antigen, E-S beta chain-like [Chanos chanos]
MTIIRLHYICNDINLWFSLTEEYYAYQKVRCASWDMRTAELIISEYFNKIEYLRFNSTLKKFTGYTEYGMSLEKRLNNDTKVLHRVSIVLNAYCKHYGLEYYPYVNKRVQPEVKLRLIKQASGRQPAILLCSAYNFYPKAIKLTWLRDGKPVISDVTSTEEKADGDWYYQIHSHLEYIPKSREKISCMVEHASFSKPMIYDWDPSGTEKKKIAAGACALVVGMTVAGAGLLHYRKKYKGQWELKYRKLDFEDRM